LRFPTSIHMLTEGSIYIIIYDSTHSNNNEIRTPIRDSYYTPITCRVSTNVLSRIERNPASEPLNCFLQHGLLALLGHRVKRRKFPDAVIGVSLRMVRTGRGYRTYFGCTCASSGIALIASAVTGGQNSEVSGSWCDVQNLEI